MTAFDYVVLAVVLASVLLGLWRGVVSEILALASWVVAFFVARAEGARVAGWIAEWGIAWLNDPVWRLAAGYVLVFVAVLLVFGVGRLLVSLMLKAVGLGLVDRLLGACFGILRGVLVVLAGVLVAGMTPLPRAAWWQEAVLSPPLETAVLAARPWLPPDVAKRIRFR